MKKSTKIIIAAVIVIVGIWGGYLYLTSDTNAPSSASSNSYGNTSQGGGGIQEHFNRAMEHFGL